MSRHGSSRHLRRARTALVLAQAALLCMSLIAPASVSAEDPPPPTGTITVTKDLYPAGDPGLFDLLIDGVAYATDVTDGGTTGAITVGTGTANVAEAAGTGTDLADYENFTVNCVEDSNPTSPSFGELGVFVDVEPGDQWQCTVTNIHKGTITVTKDLYPAGDPGLFDLLIDGVAYATDVTDGGTTGAITVGTGTANVAEAAGTGTDLADYENFTVNCVEDSNPTSPSFGELGVFIDVEPGDQWQCTVTNIHKGTITVTKDLYPAGDPGLFDLLIDGVAYATDVTDGGTTGAITVGTGTANVAEAAGTGTDLADYENFTVNCVEDSNPTSPSFGELGVFIDVEPGDQWQCTVTNVRATATITVVKDLHPSADPGRFDLRVDGIAYATDVGDGGTTGPVPVTPGLFHMVSETAQPGTNQADYASSITCVEDPEDGTNPTSPQTTPNFHTTHIETAAGDQWTCTITNTRTTITVVKDLHPSADPGRFDLRVDGIAYATDVGDGGTTGPVPVTPGLFHMVSETAQPGTNQADYASSITCVEDPEDGTNPTSPQTTPNFHTTHIETAAGDQWTCTITNTRTTITVVKDLHPSADPGRFDLRVDGIAYATDVGDGGTTGPVPVTPGLFHMVSETAQPGTNQADYASSITCVEDPEDGTNPTSPQTTPNFHTTHIETAAGDQWTCTITNTRATATLTVIKHVINDNGGMATANQWTMNVSGGNPSSSSFPGAESPGTTITVDANAAYTATESGGPPGYSASSSPGCSGSLPPGGTATCTFTNNDQAASLTVTKHVINDNGGGASAANFTMTVSGTAVPGGTTSFPGSEAGTTISLNAGTYTVTEAGPAGYTPSSGGACSAATASLGGSHACTFTNDDVAAPLAKIVFMTTRNGNFEIYSMNDDGTGLARLTNNRDFDGLAVWSPDRTRIAFTSTRNGNFEIYTMNADGTNVVRRTNHSKTDLSPSWSPDGTKLAFSSDRDGNFEIYTMTIGPTGLGTAVTRRTNNAKIDITPAWSPTDATMIAWSTTRDGNFEIYSMTVAPTGLGTALQRRTNHSKSDIDPAWSPDGTKIAWSTDRDGNFEIYTMSVPVTGAGTGLQRRTNHAKWDVTPAWSPDGSKIWFSTDRTGNFEIFKMAIPATGLGTNLVNLTNHAAFDSLPN